jgi:hypothetical protein
MAEACRSCQAPILWLDSATTGKPAPIDAAPALNGNIRVDVVHGCYFVVTGEDRQAAIRHGGPLHTNHFVTCPQRAAWKGRAKAGRG